MVEQHAYNFFGQKSALFFSSPSKYSTEAYIRMIKKKENGLWEKPSQNEGVNIKLSLEEQVQTLSVLEKEEQEWSTVHKYRENTTSIKFAWDKNDKKNLWININRYSKRLASPEIKIFRLLLSHVIQEKIENATVSKFSASNSNRQQATQEAFSPASKSLRAGDFPQETKDRENIKQNSLLMVEKGQIISQKGDILTIKFETGRVKKISEQNIHSIDMENSEMQEILHARVNRV